MRAWRPGRRVLVVAAASCVVGLVGCASGGGSRPAGSAPRPAVSAASGSCEQSADLAAQAEAARAAAREGRYDEALRLAEAVLQACGTHPVAVAALGQALVESGRADEAIARLSGLIAQHPGLAYAYYWRGKAYEAKHQSARMVDDLEAFLRLAPDAPEAAAVKQLLAALQ